jgi:peroxiredoxin
MVFLGALILVLSTVALMYALGPRFGTPIPNVKTDFTLDTLDGEHLSVADLRGHIVIVNFWTSSGLFAPMDAPVLEAVWQKYRDQGVVVIGVGYEGESLETAQAYVKQYGLTFPVGLDPDSKIAKQYKVEGVPWSYVIDGDGKVVRFLLIPPSEASWDVMLTDLLEKAS